MGYRVTAIGELEPGIIRSVRRPLQLTAFGANAIVLPAETEWFNHFHREQDELYFVHQGQAVFDVERRAAAGRGELEAIRRRNL